MKGNLNTHNIYMHIMSWHTTFLMMAPLTFGKGTASSSSSSIPRSVREGGGLDVCVCRVRGWEVACVCV